MADRAHIVVVGAGLAGLAAAWRLSRRGFAVTVLERSERPGGRAVSERVDGFCLEPLPALISQADRRVLDWIDEIGLRDEMLPLRPVTTAVAWRGDLREVDIRRLPDVRRIPGVSWREALRLVRLRRLLARYGDKIDPRLPEAASDLDDRSLVDFGRLYFGKGALEGWMVPRAIATAPGEPHEMSRVQFLHDLRMRRHERMGLLRSALADVAEKVGAGLGVRLGVEAASVEPHHGAFRVLTTGGTVEADAVVLATSAHDAARIADPLLSLAERDGLRAVRYAPSVGVAAALCRPLGAHAQQAWVPRGEDSPLATVLFEPGLPGGRVPADRGLAVLRTTVAYGEAHFETPPESLEKDLVESLDRLRPGTSRAVERTWTLRLRRAAPRFDVGRYREIARFERVQADQRHGGRRLYFAGDYLMHPSWEGSLYSAARATDAITADLTRS